MMTPKMKEDFCTQILGASRQLFLSGRISEICREKGTQKQLEFLLELLQAELTFRDENRRKCLIKRAGFPTYKTFEEYSYHCVKFPRDKLKGFKLLPAECRGKLYAVIAVPLKGLIGWEPSPFNQTFSSVFIPESQFRLQQFQNKLQLLLRPFFPADL